MIEIQLNKAKLSFDKKDNGLDLVYSLESSSIVFDLCKDEVSLLLEWCAKFPCDFGVYACFGAVKFTENDNGMPLVLIDKDGYKARVNLTKRNLGQISEYIRGVK